MTYRIGCGVIFLMAAMVLSACSSDAVVDHDGAVAPELHGDVRAGAGNHVHVRPDLNDIQIALSARDGHRRRRRDR